MVPPYCVFRQQRINAATPCIAAQHGIAVDTFGPEPALILPSLTSIFAIFLIRHYMASVPDEFLDAVRIDGATEFTVNWAIVAPFSLSGLATLVIFAFMRAWSNFL